MNRITTQWVRAGLYGFALLGLQAVMPVTATAQEGAVPADAAQVLVSQGASTLIRQSSVSSPVRTDVPLRTGDRIRTGADGHIQLRFTDGALISIHPESDFRIERYAFDPVNQSSFFELAKGAVRAVSGRIGKRDREDWRLKTPTATIGIRGTEFTVEERVCAAAGCLTGDDPGLTVSVIAGRVAVSNQAGAIEVPAGATLRLRDSATVPSLGAAVRPSGPGPAVTPRGWAPITASAAPGSARARSEPSLGSASGAGRSRDLPREVGGTAAASAHSAGHGSQAGTAVGAVSAASAAGRARDLPREPGSPGAVGGMVSIAPLMGPEPLPAMRWVIESEELPRGSGDSGR